MTKIQVIGLTILLVAVFAFGRYSAPEKIKTVEKIVEVEKKTKEEKEQEKREIHRTTTITETIKPNGEKVIVTEIREDTNVVKNKDTAIVKDKVIEGTKDEEIVKSGSHLNVALLVGNKVDLSNGIIGAHISRNLIGPISIGLFGLSSGILGASVGLEF